MKASALFLEFTRRPLSWWLGFSSWLLPIFAFQLFLPGLLLRASQPATMVVHRWDSNQGLPANSVATIHYSRDGFLWGCTLTGGIFRLDGNQVERFHPDSTPGLRSTGIQSVTEDPKGILYFGSNDGRIYRFDSGSFREIPVDPLHQGQGLLVFCQKNGTLLAGGATGLRRREGDKWYPHPRLGTPLESADISALFESRDGRLWIGTRNKGLWSLSRDGVLKAHASSNGKPIQEVQSFAEDREGRIWMGSNREGLFWVDKSIEGQDSDIQMLQLSLRSPRITSLLADPQGVLWIGTENGLNRYENGTSEPFQAEVEGLGSMQGRSIRALCQDPEGSLWFSMGHMGLFQCAPRHFRMLGLKEGVGAPEINAIVQDRQGRFWIAHPLGLDTYDTTGRKLQGPDLSAMGPHRSVKDVLIDRQNRIWIGGFSGFFQIKDRRAVRIPLSRGQEQAYARVLLEDRRGKIWIGTNQGLACLDGDQIQWWKHAQGISNDYILSLLEDSQGRIWVGTRGGGITLLDHGKIQYINQAMGLPADVVFRMLEDSEGVIWIGLPSGLARWKHGTVTALNQGINLSAVYQILEDTVGYFWLCSGRGPIRISKKALNAYLDGQGELPRYRAFHESDGLRKAEICSLSRSLKDAQGRLWFSTLDGAACIDPSEPEPSMDAPRLTLTRVLQGGAIINRSADKIRLSAGIPFEIHFTAPAFQASRHLQFQYQLEGVDPKPVEVVGRRVAYYTSIPPGSHRFQVRATDPREGGKTSVITLDLYREFLWHETWTFRVTLFVLVLASPFVLARWRTLQLRRRNIELKSQIQAATAALESAKCGLEMRVEERAQELREALDRVQVADQAKSRFLDRIGHELLTPLNHIQLNTQLARELWAQEDPPEELDRVLSAGRDLERIIQDLLHYSELDAQKEENAAKDFHPQDLIQRLSEDFRPQAFAKGLSFQMDLSAEAPARGFGNPEHISRILKELLHNALKFTPKGGITLRLCPGPDIRFEVDDTGPGVPESAREIIFQALEQADGSRTRTHGGMGMGLAMAKRLIQNMGGEIDLMALPQGGSRFWIEIPQNTTR